MKKEIGKGWVSGGILVFCLAIVPFALFGCGGSSSNSSSDASTSDSTSKTTYTVSTASALKSAISSASAGDTITISGTISLSSTLKCSNSGTSSAYITVQGGALEFSSMSVSDSNRGVQISGNYWKFYGVTIKYAGDNGMIVKGNHNYILNCKSHDNADSGFQVANGGAYNTFESCSSYANYDEDNEGENADGFACKQSNGTGNVFTSCTAYSNSDDGWDLYSAPYGCTMTSCTSYSNGKGDAGDGNGFKLGSSKVVTNNIVVKNCTAKNNLGWGFTRNGNTGTITFTGNSGSGNSKGLSDVDD